MTACSDTFSLRLSSVRIASHSNALSLFIGDAVQKEAHQRGALLTEQIGAHTSLSYLLHVIKNY